MFDVTGFSWARLKVFVIGQAVLVATTIISLHLADIPGLSQLGRALIEICIFTACTISTFIFFKKHSDKHAEVTKTIVDSISDIVIIKNYDGEFVHCNETVAKLYNSTPAEMIGKDDFHFTGNREQADFFKENVRSIMDRFEAEDVYEASTDANTGEIRHFRSKKVPFRDADNQLKILVAAKDITEITELKEEADRNKKRLEQVLDVSQEGLWEWNRKTNAVLHNSQWERITGIKRSKNSFKEFESCILSDDKDMVKNALGLLIEQNQPYSIEFRMQRPDGKIIWIWDRGRVAEYDVEGKPIWLVGIALDITEEKHNQKKIANLAYFDQLTGLANRAQLEAELQKTLEVNNRTEDFSALLFIDLDRFKLLNDSFGHHMGDKLLQGVAARLEQVNQGRGIISRFGGDEFVIVLPFLDENPDEAARLAQIYADSFLDEISKVFTLKSDVQDLVIEYAVTASVGGLIYKSGQHSYGKIIQLADTALYRVKAQGGERATIYNIGMQDELNHASDLQKSLHQAVSNREFHIHLQPKYNVDEEISGAEALIRWAHPEHGLLLPSFFIDMVEENNMILPIGAIILDQACNQLKKWQASPLTRHLEIAINLSAKQIRQNNFVEEFISTVNSHGIDHTKLIVEITESVLIQDVKDATEKLTQLKSHGISISLDDFGTGYSSLSYLRSLPIDEIKIDKSFIHDVSRDRQARLMVKSIIEMANNFNFKVVSEGVEDKEQLDTMKALGASSFQGFHFCKPLTQEEMDLLLLKQLVGKQSSQQEARAAV
ncbi:EAL domain-containing protein [Cohaesibacter haloalkalitolerans]|uniref:EAL domain-containing protein n=1 Tax=Cohaesibacter haloalkalitolerans TaxID=1162980 RepID=UPI000E6529CF|nr:EAL domain-containing protein [Cohaesibacter haloalkalitolerans]